MIYQINNLTLDVTARLVTRDGETQPIRPRTLALLQFFMAHPNQLHTTQVLLNAVWDDVEVHEGVVFQSIREIRQLFGDSKVIANFPRKGYQFVATVDALPQIANSAAQFSLKKQFACLALLLLTVALFWVYTPHKAVPVSVDSYVKNEGVNLALANISTSVNSAIAKTAIPSGLVFQQINIQVYGDSSYLNVVYNAYLGNRKLAGMLFDLDVGTLSNAVVNDMVQQFTHVRTAPLPIRWDNDFIVAATAYEFDWQAASKAFEALSSRFSDNPRLVYYLVKLKIWEQQYLQAQSLIYSMNDINLGTQWRLLFDYQQAQLYVQQGATERAIAVIEKAQKKAVEENNWKMGALLSELTGDIYYQGQQNVLALSAFQRAESMYQYKENEAGLATTRLKMAVLYIATNQYELARATYKKAETGIENHQISMLYPLKTEIREANARYLTK